MPHKERICPTLISYVSMEDAGKGKGRVSPRADTENTKKKKKKIWPGSYAPKAKSEFNQETLFIPKSPSQWLLCAPFFPVLNDSFYSIPDPPLIISCVWDNQRIN